MSSTNQPRNYDQEHKDNERQYAYAFDNVLRTFMLRSFIPFMGNPSGKSALEMGCYKGEFTEMLTQYFDDLTVIEASGELVDYTRRRVGDQVKFIHSTFETYNEGVNQFDYIFLMHTLEHLDNPVLILKKVKSWLKDDGILYLVCPNANAPSRQIAVKMGLITHNSAITPGEREHGHRSTYSLDTLEREAVFAGLNIVSRGGIFFKALANFQFDKLMGTDILSNEYLEGCYKLGMLYPDLCASIYLICKK